MSRLFHHFNNLSLPNLLAYATLCQLLTRSLKLFLKMENFRGDLGEDGFELSSDLGVLTVSVGVVVLA